MKKNSLVRQINAWLPVVAWCGVIYYFSSIESFPSLIIIWWDFLMKKAAHLIEYAILALLLFRAFWLSLGKLPTLQIGLLIWMSCLLYAVSDEWHQAFTPGRHPKWWDVLIDTLGFSIGLWYAPRIREYLRNPLLLLRNSHKRLVSTK